MLKTEFFEAAVQRGFYGRDKSTIFGKKDNVRKYWEDIFIKTSVRPAIEQILEHKDKIRIIDLGCGSGEGVELLTHVPPSTPIEAEENFMINKRNIEVYKGIDISPAMVEQGKQNYPNLPQIQFSQADLSGGFPFQQDCPYDIYFSSYCSLSHLSLPELKRLTQGIFSHVTDCGYMLFDLYGRYSPEWPKYWDKDSQTPLPYNMAYLLPLAEQNSEGVEWFDVTYWSGSELIQLIESAAAAANRKVKVITMLDRSIFVGRHMDTCFFKEQRRPIRIQVNRLFDRDYRGEINGLNLELDYLKEVKEANPQVWMRISDYRNQWQAVVSMLQALMRNDNLEVKRTIESSPEPLVDELKMLAWLYRNARRFPVVDFWASIMGPQVACVLRNLELALPRGLGCGHSLLCLVKIENK